MSQQNQLYRQLLGVSGLSSWPGNTASARLQMFSSHIGQTLCIKHPTERYIQTGMEKEYGKYTFSIRMPVDAKIIQIIDRYPETIDQQSIRLNPESLLIYEDVNTKQIGALVIPKYCSYHQYFGFEYKATPAMSKVRTNAFIAKDEIIADSHSKSNNGEYMYGRQCNVMYGSIPGVAEDGIVICEDVLPHFAYPIFERRTVEFGSKKFPLNLYGDVNNYKPFPDIGEYVRDDSILMSLRSHNKATAIMDQNIYSLMEPDATYDTNTYVSTPGGRIIDIRVQHDPFSTTRSTPVGMEIQAEKYDHARRRYHQEILNVYYQIKKKHGVNLDLTESFHRMIIESMGVINNNETTKIQKLYRRTPLDDWRIEFTIQHWMIPGTGNKLTDTFGG